MYFGKWGDVFFELLFVVAMIGAAACAIEILCFIGWAGYELIYHVSWH